MKFWVSLGLLLLLLTACTVQPAQTVVVLPTATSLPVEASPTPLPPTEPAPTALPPTPSPVVRLPGLPIVHEIYLSGLQFACAADGYLWAFDGALLGLWDPRPGERLTQFDYQPVIPPFWAYQSLWFAVVSDAGPELVSIDPFTGDELSRLPFADLFGPDVVISGGLEAAGWIWLIDTDGHFWLMSPDQVFLDFAGPSGARALAFDDYRIWVAGTEQTWRIDAGSAEVIDKLDLQLTALTYGNGRIWALDETGALLSLDPETAEPESFGTVCAYPSDLAWNDGLLWVTCPPDQSLIALQP